MELSNKQIPASNEERDQKASDVPDSGPQMLHSIQKSLSQVLLWLRLLLISFVIGFIIFGLIYNFFSKPENDIPAEVFNKFYEILGTDSSSLFPGNSQLKPEGIRNSSGK